MGLVVVKSALGHGIPTRGPASGEAVTSAACRELKKCSLPAVARAVLSQVPEHSLRAPDV